MTFANIKRILEISTLATMTLSSMGEDLFAAEKAFVTADKANVRLCDSTKCPSINILYRGQVVEFFETKGDWVRISQFYDSASEMAEFPSLTAGIVARWVHKDLLSVTQPLKLTQPKLDTALMDPRIQGLPDVGEYGLSKSDVTLLRRYSLQLTNGGVGSGIEGGDKSIKRTGYYYVICTNEPVNRFFTASDVD